MQRARSRKACEKLGKTLAGKLRQLGKKARRPSLGKPKAE
jgi:RimJ/RimL family protein N-acetyltransferase